MSRTAHYRHPVPRQLPEFPRAIAGAEWQAGVTPDSDESHILLDGQPLPMAFAASAKDGWVLAYAEPVKVLVEDPNGPRIRAFRIPQQPGELNPTGSAARCDRFTGRVQIVRG